MKWLDLFKIELRHKNIIEDFEELTQIKRRATGYYSVRYQEQTTIRDKATKELEELESKIKEIVEAKLVDKITNLIMSELYDSLSETVKQENGE